MEKDKILIIGGNGFIAKNLIINLRNTNYKIETYKRGQSFKKLINIITNCKIVFHLAGINRPKNEKDYYTGNYIFTKKLINNVFKHNKNLKIIFSSTTQVNLNNKYGLSKKKSEDELIKFSKSNNIKLAIFRLPNIFGKFSKPNYNSFIATICYNLIHKKNIEIHDNKKLLHLCYVDDLIKDFINFDKIFNKKINFIYPSKIYTKKIISIFNTIEKIHNNHLNNLVYKSSSGLERALLATYLSFLKPKKFTQTLNSNVDKRGQFVEFIKTINSGQFSYFTINKGYSRGSHFHHTKNEKFLLIHGNCKVIFRNILSGKINTINVRSSDNILINAIPGWSHKFVNIGKEKAILLVWSNELLNMKKTDTFFDKVINEKN